jgi:hypothetical protein
MIKHPAERAGCPPELCIFMTASTPRNQTRPDAPQAAAWAVSARRHRLDGRNALRAFGTAVLLMATAACSTRSDLDYASLASEVPTARAIIVPPPGGPSVVAVLQQRYQNGVSQEIALSTASLTRGQNAFYVSLLNNNASDPDATDTLTIPRLTEDRIAKEMEDRIPGVEMETSLVYVQNRFGPFGFATGRSPAGDLCLYAWQRIEPGKPAVFVPGGTISVRLRLCDADASVDQLLRVMYGYTIAAYYRQESWNPYGEAPPPPAGLGQPDAPMYPLGLGNSTVTRQQSRPGQTRRAAPVRTRSERPIDKDTVLPTSPAQPEGAPPSGYPVVPPPPGQ